MSLKGFNPMVVQRVSVAVLLLALAGCASGPQANPKDPLEPMNRHISQFNEDLDGLVLKPAATQYREHAPEPLQAGVRNFFRNVGDVFSTVNNAMQLKGRETAESFMRVVVNTVLGLGGVLDVATSIGLTPHPEDFGQTLGYWGVPQGPYLVLPILGSSSVRDGAAWPFEFKLDPVRQAAGTGARNTALVLRVVSKRASYLSAETLLNEAALDRYSFTRDAYLQYRQYQVYDGDPPDEPDLFDPGADPSSTR